MNTSPTRKLLPGVLLTLAMLTGACTSGGPSATVTPSAAATASAPAASATAGPSAAARMVCSSEAAEDIEGALGIGTTRPPKATWSDRLYSCPYEYPSGTMRLSVKDLPDTAAVEAYFSAAERAGGRFTVLRGMGEGAFEVGDGSVFVRKDLTVLHVDVKALPAVFGTPSRTRSQVGRTVATTVLICWREA